jgi:hypothetical protein
MADLGLITCRRGRREAGSIWGAFQDVDDGGCEARFRCRWRGGLRERGVNGGGGGGLRERGGGRRPWFVGMEVKGEAVEVGVEGAGVGEYMRNLRGFIIVGGGGAVRPASRRF